MLKTKLNNLKHFQKYVVSTLNNAPTDTEVIWKYVTNDVLNNNKTGARHYIGIHSDTAG
jgi:hypothetical protein